MKLIKVALEFMAWVFLFLLSFKFDGLIGIYHYLVGFYAAFVLFASCCSLSKRIRDKVMNEKNYGGFKKTRGLIVWVQLFMLLGSCLFYGWFFTATAYIIAAIFLQVAKSLHKVSK